MLRLVCNGIVNTIGIRLTQVLMCLAMGKNRGQTKLPKLYIQKELKSPTPKLLLLKNKLMILSKSNTTILDKLRIWASHYQIMLKTILFSVYHLLRISTSGMQLSA